MEDPIPVIPQINGHRDHLSPSILRESKTNSPTRERRVSFAKSSRKSIDPDVRKMMEGSANDFNVTKLKHTKTKEETDSEADNAKACAGTSSWVIIVMAIVVILLICAIVYLVLKYNESCDPPPESLLSNLRRKKGEVIKKPPQINPHMNLRQRTLQPLPAPQNAQPMHQPRSRGTKEELMQMLQRTSSGGLTDIPEGEEDPEPKKETEAKPPTSDGVDESQKPKEEDSSMINDFYRQMEMNANNEDDSTILPEE